MRRITGAGRNLVLGVAFVCAVSAAAIAAYMANGWPFGDALYFTVLTVFTVGYDEVHPVASPVLRVVTIALIVLGCSGTIFVTGALVQFFAFSQINEMLGNRRMKNQIEALDGHVIICGYGRIGVMLARDLAAGGKPFVVLELSEKRHAEAVAHDHLCLIGDATEEELLKRAGIERASALASVLPDDALNVFITLSARSLNANLIIIARGEAAATERKLLQAGANRVVMPAHIGAERIAQIILFPDLSDTLRAPHREISAGLEQLGLLIETIVVEAGAAFSGCTVSEIEQRAAHGFMILAVQLPGAAAADSLSPNTRIAPGSGVTVVVRTGYGVALGGFRQNM